MAAIALMGCGSEYAGNYIGEIKPSDPKKFFTMGKKSETKPITACSLQLNRDGTYSAKLLEIDYAGTWTQKGATITLTPKTYMGIERKDLGGRKQAVAGDALDKFFLPYELEVQKGSKTLTHTDKEGVTTFTKSG
jgi:hypothetical protein